MNHATFMKMDGTRGFVLKSDSENLVLFIFSFMWNEREEGRKMEGEDR